MASQGFDGFDHYNTLTDLLLRTGGLVWTNFGYQGGASITVNFSTDVPAPTASNPGKSLQIYSIFSYTTAQLSVGLFSGIYTGAHIKAQSDNTAQSFRILLFDPVSNLYQCYANINLSSGIVSIYQNGNGSPDTLLAISNSNQINFYSWNFIEFGWVGSATNGYVELRVNGRTAATASAVNTIGTGAGPTAGIITYQMGIGTGICSHWNMDNIYVNDNSTGPGSYPCNGFMGDCRVATVFANNNVSVAWTPHSTTNWQQISETAFDGDTTYNYSATPGNVDLFTGPPVTGVISRVIAVRLTGAYYKTDASARSVAQVLNSNGTQVESAPHILSNSYQWYSDTWMIDPSTGASWTTNGANSVQFGYDLKT